MANNEESLFEALLGMRRAKRERVGRRPNTQTRSATQEAKAGPDTANNNRGGHGQRDQRRVRGRIQKPRGSRPKRLSQIEPEPALPSTGIGAPYPGDVDSKARLPWKSYTKEDMTLLKTLEPFQLNSWKVNSNMAVAKWLQDLPTADSSSPESSLSGIADKLYGYTQTKELSKSEIDELEDLDQGVPIEVQASVPAADRPCPVHIERPLAWQRRRTTLISGSCRIRCQIRSLIRIRPGGSRVWKPGTLCGDSGWSAGRLGLIRVKR